MKKKPNKLSPQFKWMKTSLLLCFLSLGVMSVSAQSKTITGHVQDSNKQPLTGVSVVVKGTTNGTMTDADGNYSLSAKVGDVVTASFIGMTPFTFTVGNTSKVNIVLEDDVVALGGAEGVTVVGYGSAKTKDLTSNIPTVKGEELSKHLTASAMSGMQGKVAGVQIVNSGAPGSSPKVHIRGIGNLDADKQGPLYVVDGMLFDDISFISSSDIASMTIMKDASSAAIYGVRAANGVVIITTKSGVLNAKPQITYEGSYGIQVASNLVKLANSREYTDLEREMSVDLKDATVLNAVNKSMELYGKTTDGYPVANTNWYDEMLRSATIQNHSINISGGSEKITYTLGVNYMDQNGIANIDNYYKRLNVRSRFDAKITPWLKAGANIVISNSSQKTAEIGAFQAAFQSPSIMPIYDEKNTSFPIKFTDPTQLGFKDALTNPVATLYYNDDNNTKELKLLPSFFTEFSFLKDKLTIRNSFNQDINFSRYQKFVPDYYMGGDRIRKPETAGSVLTKTNNFNNNWIIDNIATYKDNIANHSFSFMLGNSIRRERWEELGGEAKKVPGEEDQYKYIDQGKQDSRKASDGGSEFRGVSFFARAMYNYSDKYLASFTFRRDGSSKYQEMWGNFPSVGLGWVISKENFMANQKVFDLIKLRANWGKLGNDKVQASDGFASLETGQDAIMGGTVYPGYTSSSYFSSLSWEVVEETDLGIDLNLLSNRLSISFDYYDRNTINAVFRKTVPNSNITILVNNGRISNAGTELTLGWTDNIGKDWNYNLGFNMSTLKNKITYLDGVNRIPGGSGEFPTVRQVGESMDSYLGYEVVGVYQNQAEIDADPMAKGSTVIPGDLKFKDQDGDNALTANDRIIMGSYIPKLYLGGNIGVNYKQWDFNLSYQGKFGFEVVNQKRVDRKLVGKPMNFDKDFYDNRWHGEGTSNSYPSSAGLNSSWMSAHFNTFALESGNTFTIQNIQLGYTFNNIFPKSNSTAKLRLSATAERPFSFFSYNGFTTDVADGFDNSIYPLASVYSFGIKLVY